MPNIDLTALAKTALDQGIAAAKGHAKDLETYLHARVHLMADGAERIAADRLSGAIDDDDVKFAFEEIRASEKTALLTVQVTLKAAAQDAINAALGVVAAGVNSAVGLPIL